MKSAAFIKSLVAIGIVASFAWATDLFVDDFSNCATTQVKWAPSNPDSMVVACGSGVLSIQNKQVNAAALEIHAFAVKPATLTASVKITRTSDAAAPGFIICMQMPPSFAGYAIQLNAAQSITVYKYASSTTELYSNFSSYIKGGAATNVVRVSKTGNRIFLFCNDHFIDSITDATSPLANGDFALLIPRNSTATFDDVLISDLPPVIPSQNCINDGFNDNATYPWGDLSLLANTQEIGNQYLSINTMASGAYDYHYIDYKADTFSMKAYLSFRKGRTNSLYGLFIKGVQPPSGTRVPMAYFALNAGKRFDCYTDSITLPSIGSTFIYGPPYINGTDTSYYWDTVEVVKTAASAYYKMTINGVLLDSLPASKVDFSINGVGVFCDDSLSLYVDTFFVKSGVCSPIVNTARTPRLLKRAVFNPATAEYLVNPLGRKVYRLEYFSSSRKNRALTPGYYISNNGKSGVVVKQK